MDEIFRFTVGEELEMAVRVLLASVYGAAVGFEREQAYKAAGMRTMALVALGSAGFTVASVFSFPDDPARLAAGIVTGIGFIGAGAIFREGLSIRGLTTAASIWVTAAIGVAVGAGMYVLSAVAALLALVILHLLPKPRES